METKGFKKSNSDGPLLNKMHTFCHRLELISRLHEGIRIGMCVKGCWVCRGVCGVCGWVGVYVYICRGKVVVGWGVCFAC